MGFIANLAAAAAAIIFVSYYLLKTKKSPTITNDPEICAMVLRAICYDGSANTNTLSPAESRAIPNQRLIRAFSIANAFTTTNSGYVKLFRKRAENSMNRLDSNGWKRFADLTEQLVRTGIGQPRAGITKIRLDALTQSVSLKIVLHVLFALDPLQLDNNPIQALAEGIHYLWVKSKGDTPITDEDREKVTGPIVQLFGSQSTNLQDNKMNLILPAYETLWRVVLFGCIEVVFGANAHPGWNSALAQYLAHPEPATFTRRAHDPSTEAVDTEVSVHDIVQESLRLYPPTKRVYRAYKTASQEIPNVVAADIEACHRLPHIWGDDSKQFVPSRWAKMEEETHQARAMKKAFMPFGGGQFICPAGGVFGPRMIGLLIAGLAGEVKGAECRLWIREAGSEVVREFSGEGWLDSRRVGYEWMEISRRG